MKKTPKIIIVRLNQPIPETDRTMQASVIGEIIDDLDVMHTGATSSNVVTMPVSVNGLSTGSPEMFDPTGTQIQITVSDGVEDVGKYAAEFRAAIERCGYSIKKIEVLDTPVRSA